MRYGCCARFKSKWKWEDAPTNVLVHCHHITSVNPPLITSRVNKLDDNLYIQKVFQNLNDERQKTCILLLDEVYVKAMLQYHGGILFGKAVNHPSKLANTVLSFMVITLFGGPKFLCKMLPVCNLSANFVFEQTNLLFDAIENAGGKVTSWFVMATGWIKLFSKCLILFHHGVRQMMFLLFDFVHLFKCIRNNWITEKNTRIRVCLWRRNENSKMVRYQSHI